MEYWTDLYNEIADRIGEHLPEIEWIDLWHEQVNYLTEELPCVARICAAKKAAEREIYTASASNALLRITPPSICFTENTNPVADLDIIFYVLRD